MTCCSIPSDRAFSLGAGQTPTPVYSGDDLIKWMDNIWAVLAKNVSYEIGYMSVRIYSVSVFVCAGRLLSMVCADTSLTRAQDTLSHLHIAIMFEKVVEKMTEHVQQAASESFWGRVGSKRKSNILLQAEQGTKSAQLFRINTMRKVIKRVCARSYANQYSALVL